MAKKHGNRADSKVLPRLSDTGSKPAPTTGDMTKEKTGQPESRDEAEAVRQELLAKMGDVEDPGAQHHLDTLVDRAYLADHFFETHILEDPACLHDPELFRAAWSVANALADFYQAAGNAAAAKAGVVAEPSR